MQSGTKIKIALFLLGNILLAGCFLPHPGRESAFAVRGNIIPVHPTEPPPDCELQLYRSRDDRKVQEISVSLKFERSFVIAPGIHKYYMVVRCPGDWTYKTNVYELGATEHFVHPVDLGDIRLTHSGTK